MTVALKIILIAVYLVFVPWGTSYTISSLAQISADIGFMDLGPHLFLQNAQFGPDVVLTYGPLEFLAFGPPAGLVVPYYIFRVILAAIVPLWSMRCVAHKPLPFQVAAAGVALFSGYIAFSGLDQAFWITPAIAIVLFRLFRSAERRLDLLHWSTVAVISILALVKFSFLIIGAWGFVILAMDDAVLRRRVPTASLAFVICTAAVWLVCGQSPANFGIWIVRSLEISSGYGEAMPKGWLFPFSLTEVILLYLAVSLLPLALFLKPTKPGLLNVDRARSALLAVFLGGIGYVGIRYAFGGNMLLQVTIMNLVVLFFVGLRMRSPVRKWDWHTGLVLSGICCIGILSIDRGWVPAALVARTWAADNARLIVDVVLQRRPFLNNFDNWKSQINALSQLPASLSGTTDIYPWKTSIVLANANLEYRQRPVYLSYVAYTANLAMINRDFLRSPRAPDNILFEITPADQRIDDRYPATADGPSWPEILARYQPVSTRRDFAMLRRREFQSQHVIQPLRAIVGHLGEPIQIKEAFGAPAQRLLWATIDVQPSMFGQLLSLLYKSPPIELAVTTADGVEHRHQLVRGLGQAGFLLSPYIDDTGKFLALAASAARNDWNSPVGSPVTSLTVKPRGGPHWFYHKDYAITLSMMTFSGGKLNEQGQKEIGEIIALRNISREPRKCLFPPKVFSSADSSGYVILAHAPCSIPVAIPEGSRRMTIGYGLRDTAFNNPEGKSRGAMFRIFARSSDDASGETGRLIWSALLNPTMVEADRGLHTLTLSIDNLAFPYVGPGSSTELIFETAPKPGTDPSYDHTYWSDLKFLPDSN